MLEVSAEFAQNITFNSEIIQNALPAGHLDATTLADYLVKKLSHDIPFRTSHDIVGRSVALRSISPVFDQDVYEYLGVENSIKKFSSYGSTGSECVASQLDYWMTRLNISREIHECLTRNLYCKGWHHAITYVHLQNLLHQGLTGIAKEKLWLTLIDFLWPTAKNVK